MKLEAINPALGTIAAGSSSKAAGIASDELGHGDRLGVYDDDVTRSFTFAEVFNDVSETNHTGIDLGEAGVVGEEGADDHPPGVKVGMAEPDTHEADCDHFGIRDLLILPRFALGKVILEVAGCGNDQLPWIC